MTASLKLTACCALLLGAFAADTLAAERTLNDIRARFREPKPRVVEDVFRAEVSVVGAVFDTNVRLDDDNTNAPGTNVNIEDDLGLDDSRTLIQAEITFLPGTRHLVRLSGQASRRTKTKFVQKNINFKGDNFVVGDLLTSKLDLTLFGLTYGYRFLKRERLELDGTFSIQLAEIDANITGGKSGRTARDAEGGVAPIPLVGLEARYDFGKRWSAEGRAQYVGANARNIRAAILDARTAVTWRQNPYIVYGIGYRKFLIDVESDDPGNSGSVALKVSGPMLFLRGSL